jgi:XTP/dITP diphosphohydrolase
MLDRPIILATRNEGKIKEFRELLKDYEVEFRGLNDFGPIPEVEEDGGTFEENAYKKASETSKMLGFPALADDSGLVVEALRGEPGVRSARYAGEGASDEENYRKLLQAMKGETNRKAAFHCTISIAVPRGPALTYEATCEGEILDRPVGDKGFGYDPVFYYPPLQKSFAQLSREEKNRVSHRGRAMAELKGEFRKVLLWLEQRLREELY